MLGLSFPAGAVVKNLPASVGDSRDTILIPVLGKIPWKRQWQPTPVFLPREFHGQRTLACYSPWGCKESDTTEQLTQRNNILGLFSKQTDKMLPTCTVPSSRGTKKISSIEIYCKEYKARKYLHWKQNSHKQKIPEERVRNISWSMKPGDRRRRDVSQDFMEMKEFSWFLRDSPVEVL